MIDSASTVDLPISDEAAAGSQTAAANSDIAAAGSQTTAADSDMEWLEELFHIPTQEAPEPNSDDEWLLELCRSMPERRLAARTAAVSPNPVEFSTEPDDAGNIRDIQQVHSMLLDELPLGIHVDALIIDFSTRTLQNNWVERLNSHIVNVIQRLGSIVAYKIGITSDPSFRMYNPSWGYAPTENFEEMHLLLAASPKVCAHMERKLIALNRGKQGCRNSAPGGENTPRTPPCYTYLVTVACGDGIGIQQRGKRKHGTLLHGRAKKARLAWEGDDPTVVSQRAKKARSAWEGGDPTAVSQRIPAPTVRNQLTSMTWLTEIQPQPLGKHVGRHVC